MESEPRERSFFSVFRPAEGPQALSKHPGEHLGVQSGAEEAPRRRTLVIACGALVHEIRFLLTQPGLAGAYDLAALPSQLHNRPELIAPRLEAKIRQARPLYQHILIGYGDCGTGGGVDALCRKYGVTRLPGDHCYAFYAGLDTFAALCEEELGTFFLTDYLARFFPQLILRGLGIEANPSLKSVYFGNYRRLVYLAQRHDPELDARAEQAATSLGLAYERRWTGYGLLAETLRHTAARQESVPPGSTTSG